MGWIVWSYYAELRLYFEEEKKASSILRPDLESAWLFDDFMIG